LLTKYNSKKAYYAKYSKKTTLVQLTHDGQEKRWAYAPFNIQAQN